MIKAVDARIVRAILSWPRGCGPAVDGADHLCQRFNAGRSRYHLWYRVLELHGQRCIHLRRCTDDLVGKMQAELERNGVDWRIRCDVTRIEVGPRGVEGVVVNGRRIRCRAVVSNSNLRGTIFNLVGREHFDPQFIADAEAVRLNNSSTQVYMALKEGEEIEESTGDLLFCSTAPLFRTEMLLSRDITSRRSAFTIHALGHMPNADLR